MRSVVTTSLPCITSSGSTTMPLGVTTPTARLFRSPPAASSSSGVGLISMVSGSPRVRGVAGVMSMVKGSRVVPLGASHVARCFVAHRDAHVHRQGHCGGREVHVDAAWQVSAAVKAQGSALRNHRCGHAGLRGNLAGELRSGWGWCRRRRWARCWRWGWSSAAAAPTATATAARCSCGGGGDGGGGGGDVDRHLGRGVDLRGSFRHALIVLAVADRHEDGVAGPLDAGQRGLGPQLAGGRVKVEAGPVGAAQAVGQGVVVSIRGRDGCADVPARGRVPRDAAGRVLAPSVNTGCVPSRRHLHRVGGDRLGALARPFSIGVGGSGPQVVAHIGGNRRIGV